RGRHRLRARDLGELGVPFGRVGRHGPVGGVAVQDRVALGQQLAALQADQLVVAPGVAVQFEGDAFGDALGVPHDPVRALVGDEPVLVGGGLRLLVGRVAGDEIVLEAGEEHRGAGVALAAGAAAELVVEAAAVVAAGPDDQEAARRRDPVVVASPGLGGRGTGRRGAAGVPGGAAADVGGAGARAVRARLGDGRGPVGVVLGVEHDRVEAGAAQAARQPLGLGDVAGADQHRAAGGVRGGDLLDERDLLVGGGRVEAVG